MSSESESSARAFAGKRIDRVLSVLLWLGLAVIGIESVYLIFSLGLIVDEAWIVNGIESLATSGRYATSKGPGATTTGGVHVLVQVVVARLSSGSLPAMRFVSTLSLAALLWEVHSWARSAGISRTGSLIATTALIGIPGTVVLASTAFAAIATITPIKTRPKKASPTLTTRAPRVLGVRSPNPTVKAVTNAR